MCLVLRVEGGSLSRPTAAKGGLSVPRLTGLTHYRPEALVTCLPGKCFHKVWPSLPSISQLFPTYGGNGWARRAERAEEGVATEQLFKNLHTSQIATDAIPSASHATKDTS